MTYNYEYDSSGIRTRKTNFDGGYTEYYVVEGLAVAEQRFTAKGAKQYILRYLYDESNSPIGFGIYYPTASSPYWQYYYFGKNLQGDVVALYRCDYKSSDKSYYPTLVATYTYDPWGAPTGIYDANGNTISQTSHAVAAYNPFRYRGYRYDGDTRLYYLQSRYYDPAIGRFVNADAYASTGQSFAGYNMFAYCNNNPVVFCDSNGTEAVIATIVIVGSAIATGFFTYLDGGSVGDIIKNSLRAGTISGLAWFTGELYGTVVAKTASAMVGAAITNIVLQDSNSKMDWVSLGVDVICSATSEVFSTALSKFNPDLDDASKALGGVGIDVGKSAIVTTYSIFKESSRGSRPPLPPVTKQQRLNVVQRRATRNKTKQAVF